MKISPTYGIVVDESSPTSRVRCAFCGVFIPKASKCIEQHTNGAKHKENIEIMAQHGMIFNNENCYCRPCQCTLAVDESVLKHIESDDHSTWLAAMEDLVDGEFIILDPYLTSEKEDVFCEACNSFVPCTLQALEEHVNNFNHRTNVCEKLKPLNGIFPVDNNDEVWCKVCDSYIENTIQGILEHIDDDPQHMNWFAEIEDLIFDQDISIENYLSNEHENNAFCSKCQMEIICDAQSIEDHVNSELHLNNIISVTGST